MARIRCTHVLTLLAATGCTAAHVAPDAIDASGGSDAGAVLPPADAGTDAAAADAAVTRSGCVSVSYASTGAAALSGYFGPVPAADAIRGLMTPSCVVVDEAGPCVAVRCGEALCTPAGALEAVLPGDDHVRAVSRVSGTYGGGPTEIYYAEDAAGVAIAAGDTVRVSSSGGVVPPFDVELIAPPPPLAALPTQISRSEDLMVTWAPSTADGFLVMVFADGLDPPFIQCRVPGSASSLSLAQGLVRHYAEGTSLAIDVTAFDATTVTAGPYSVEVMLAPYVSSTAVVVP